MSGQRAIVGRPVHTQRPSARGRHFTGSSQATLAQSITVCGIGVHSGQSARLTIHPSDARTGLTLLRTGLPAGRERFIPVGACNVVSSHLATCLAPREAPADSVGTVEHVLAALAVLGIDNALLEVDGPEMPILDGSAKPFVDAIEEVGIVTQRAPRRFLEIVAPVRVSNGAAFAEFRPHLHGLQLDIAIDYAHPAVGRQRIVSNVDASTFRQDIAPARTFGFVQDAECLWREGFAQGSSFENTVVIGDAVLNPGGLRFPDEFVRHKLLDAIGDLALLGASLRGAFRSFRGGHALNRAAVAALLADRSAWRVVEGPPASRRPPTKRDDLVAALH